MSIVFAVGLLIGCSGRSVHVKEAPDSVPTGWSMTQSSDGQVRVAVPSGWRHGVDRMDGGFGGIEIPQHEGGEAIQQIGDDFQRQADTDEQAELLKLEEKGVLVNVISMGNKPIIGEARTRYYVLKTAGGATTLEAAADVERTHFAQRPKYETIQLPIGEAIKTSVRDELRDGGIRHQISYVVVDGSDIYSLRFVTQEDPQVINSIAEQVAQTWRIKPQK